MQKLLTATYHAAVVFMNYFILLTKIHI